jgi:type IX secretion system PorP/SprF family membrane protein
LYPFYPKKSCLIIATSLLLIQTALGQFMPTAQYFSSPLTLNPALTGKFDGDFRVTAKVPSVGASFVSSSFSAEVPVLRSFHSKLDYWGVGFRAMKGQSASGIMSSREYAFSTAYTKGLDEQGYHQLGVGFQASFHRNRINTLDLTPAEPVPVQELPLAVPVDLMRTDNILNMQYPDYTDLSTGFLYSGTTNGRNNFYLGGAAFHLNNPLETSLDNKLFYGISPQYIAHGGASFHRNEARSSYYVSSVYSNQANRQLMMLGGVFGYNLVSGTEFSRTVYAGIWGKYSEPYTVLMPYLGMDYNGFRMGVSYDFQFQKSTTVRSPFNKVIEITLIYERKQDWYRTRPHPRF